MTSNPKGGELSWNNNDYIKAREQGFAIGVRGRFYSTQPNIIPDTHETMTSWVATLANEGNELAGRALAEALRRRMTN